MEYKHRFIVIAIIGLLALLFLKFNNVAIAPEDAMAKTQLEEYETALYPSFSVYWDEIAVRDEIIYQAGVYGVDTHLALKLAKIESNFNPLAENPNSTAKGIYQWLDGSWEYYCEGNVFHPRDNISCAMRVISEGGISNWLADPRTGDKIKDLL